MLQLRALQRTGAEDGAVIREWVYRHSLLVAVLVGGGIPMLAAWVMSR